MKPFYFLMPIMMVIWILFVGPGGNNSQPNSREMQNRLFKNDGKGNFTIDAGAFGNNLNGVNTAVAIAYDFNHDGFPDFLLGEEVFPGNMEVHHRVICL